VDLDAVVAACREALTEDKPVLAVREVVASAVADAGGGQPLVPDTGVKLLHRSDDLTVLHVMIPSGRPPTLPHDHRMWAVVGIYGGQEDNAFYRRTPAALEASGGRELATGDVLAMGDDVIHAIQNPRRHEALLALHVYGGDLVAAERSMWLRDTHEERPYDDRMVVGGDGIR
jgi:predicted metal-dependent enzyme (double-stranded beta helix superfamily)